VLSILPPLGAPFCAFLSLVLSHPLSARAFCRLPSFCTPFTAGEAHQRVSHVVVLVVLVVLVVTRGFEASRV